MTPLNAEDRVPARDAPRRHQGVVTYHNLEKAYGKIHGDGVEYFFHTTACDGTFRALVEGTPVSFTWATTEKGPRAFAVCEDHVAVTAALEVVDARGNR